MEEGAWREVRRRRDSRPVGRRKVPPTGWRLGTTFLFRNFPESCRVKDLWKRFGEIGKVEDIFIPAKRDRMGLRFGFVRISRGGSEREILDKLNNVWFGSYIIRAFIPIHNRNPRVEGGRWERSPADNIIPLTGERESARVGGTVSYAEVVGKERRRDAGAAGEKTVVPRAHVFVCQDGEKEWVQGAFVGCLKDQFRWKEYEEEISAECVGCLSISYMGHNLVLIRSTIEKSSEEVVSDFLDWTSFWFSWCRPWKPSDVCRRRLIWTKWLGVPLHAWSGRFFEIACSPFGKFVALHKVSMLKERLDAAWVQVETGLESVVCVTEFSIDGTSFPIRVEECCCPDSESSTFDSERDSGGESDFDSSAIGRQEMDELSEDERDRRLLPERGDEVPVVGGGESNSRESCVPETNLEYRIDADWSEGAALLERKAQMIGEVRGGEKGEAADASFEEDRVTRVGEEVNCAQPLSGDVEGGMVVKVVGLGDVGRVEEALVNEILPTPEVGLQNSGDGPPSRMVSSLPCSSDGPSNVVKIFSSSFGSSQRREERRGKTLKKKKNWKKMARAHKGELERRRWRPFINDIASDEGIADKVVSAAHSIESISEKGSGGRQMGAEAWELGVKLGLVEIRGVVGGVGEGDGVGGSNPALGDVKDVS